MGHAAVAAGLLLAVAGGVYTYKDVLFPSDGYSTKVGDLNALSLADGSQITLNTNSHIRVALEPKQRRIELDKGEAFFEVAHDPNRPFVVESGNKRVIAVGTKFSVRRDHDDIRVAVTEGRVRVEDIKGSSDVFLGAGSIAQTANTEILVKEHATPEVEQLLSWRSGYLVFRDTTLADAVAEFNRYNTRQIIIEDPTVSAIRVGGNFRSNNTDAFLWLLQQGFPIAVEDTGDKVVLRHR
jgi:transmembrane sensor